MEQIEHLWVQLKPKVSERYPTTATFDELGTALVEEWDRTAQDYNKKLIRAFIHYKQLQAVITARGGHTLRTDTLGFVANNNFQSR